MKFFLLGFLAFYALLGAAHARDTYAGVYGGANYDDVIVHPIVEGNQMGYVVGAVLGTDVPAVPGLYIEADISFRQNDVDLFGGALHADHDTTALLGNVLYQVPIDFPVRPYVLVGAGYGHTEATFENVSLLRLEASGFAWQLGTGANARVADGITAGIGYRFLQVPSLNVFGTELSDGTNHAIVAEMRFAL